MECREAHPLLIDLLYGGLSVDAKVDLERHLADCADCLDGFETLRSGQEHLAVLPQVESNMRFVFARPEKVSLVNRIRDGIASLGTAPRWAAAFLLPIAVVYGLVLATGKNLEVSKGSVHLAKRSSAGQPLAARTGENQRTTDELSGEPSRPPVENVSSETPADRKLLIQEMVRRMKPGDRQALARALLGYYEERTESELTGREDESRRSDSSDAPLYKKVRTAY